MDKSLSKTVRWLLLIGLLATLTCFIFRHFMDEQIASSKWIRCRSNKVFIRVNVAVFADERGLTNGQPIDHVAFRQFLATNTTSGTLGRKMACPSGGSYSFSAVGETPTCSYTNQISYWWWDAGDRRLRRSTASHND